MTRKQKAGLLIFFFVLVITGAMIPSRFAVTLSPSLDYRVFFLSNFSTFEKGDYVLFYVRSEHIEKPTMAIKKIACDEGETLIAVEIGNKSYFCVPRFAHWFNHEYIGTAKEYSLKGEKLESFAFNGKIPKGYAFVVGQHKDSYDSRYFGLVRKSEIKAKAYPIF